MKKVLIITYYFGQMEQIGASRLRGLAKFLPEFGWEPVVMTPKTEMDQELNTRIEETDYKDLVFKWKKMLGVDPDKSLKGAHGLPEFSHKNRRTVMDLAVLMWEEVFAYPDLCSGWYEPAVEVGRQLVRREEFCAMISSSSPVTCHLIAKDLKKEFGIPWIADLRDLWTQNHYYRHSNIRKLIEGKLERDTLALADCITTVSTPLEKQLAMIHRNKQIHTIQNGYNPQDRRKSLSLTNRFSITYTGSLYRGRRDPEPLFEALRELIDIGKMDSKDIELIFVGEAEEWLAKDVRKYALEDVVSILGKKTREEALGKQRESQMLLLLTWNDARELGVYTGKLFDYLASMRPILSIGVRGNVIDDLLRRTNTGVHVSTVDEVKELLLRKYSEFKLTGKVKYDGRENELSKYSQEEMSMKFAEILNEISA